MRRAGDRAKRGTYIYRRCVDCTKSVCFTPVRYDPAVVRKRLIVAVQEGIDNQRPTSMIWDSFPGHSISRIWDIPSVLIMHVTGGMAVPNVIKCFCAHDETRVHSDWFAFGDLRARAVEQALIRVGRVTLRNCLYCKPDVSPDTPGMVRFYFEMALRKDALRILQHEPLCPSMGKNIRLFFKC